MKSFFDELNSVKNLIAQLKDLEDSSYNEEILTNKKRIIEVRPILPKLNAYYKFCCLCRIDI